MRRCQAMAFMLKLTQEHQKLNTLKSTKLMAYFTIQARKTIEYSEW